ncbi:hypothetical protein BGW42_002325 [Actinomortierella wolfii]|nr:hypothetical protein BGW42_002325 [Actinomortierella wolfii]
MARSASIRRLLLLFFYLQYQSNASQTSMTDNGTVFEEDTVIGSGAYGTVYQTYWETRRVAVKKVHVTQDEVRRVAAIQNEIDILQKLKHRHIIQFFDTIYHENMLVLIMDYAEGGSLFHAIEGGRVVDWKTKTRIAQEIVRGLEYIHYKGVLHRDLKSHNVLLTSHMEVKLCDFGLATVKIRSVSKSTGNTVGTFRWMAPELFSARPQYSTKSDMYSLGMVMWEMAANCTVPFKNQPDNQIVATIIRSGERELLPDDIPIDYSYWVQRCWEHDPQKRPEASEMVTKDEDVVFALPAGVEMLSITPIHSTSSKSPPSSRSTQTGDARDQPFENVSALLKRTNSGDVEAQVSLAAMYEKGDVVARNNTEAFQWYLRAAAQGSTEAQVKAGIYLLNGRGTDVHHGAAMYWIHQAAVKRDPRAECLLGSMHENGQGVKQDFVKAASWYLKSAEQGYAEAQCNLGFMYSYNRGVEQDDVEAVSWFLKSAKQGYARAQCNLGVMYEHGSGVKQDYTKAASWYRKAAEQGFAAAQCNLGLMYDDGRGVRQDYIEAAWWYRKSAEQEYAMAQCNLGLMYDDGRGVKQDHVEAVTWYLKSAEQGYATAQCNLGVMYEFGIGVKQDHVEAMSWYRKAAAQGNTRAQCNLEVMYEFGIGVKQSYAETTSWHHKASEQGEPRGQWQIIETNKNGKSVTKAVSKLFGINKKLSA